MHVQKPIPATFLMVTAFVGVVVSALLWSSPEYRERHLLVACAVAAVFARRLLWPVLRGTGWAGVLFGVGLLLVHAASLLGGLWHGETLLAATARGVAGILGVTGLAVFAVVLLDPRWRTSRKCTALWVLGLLLAGSFIGFFIGIERFIPAGKYSVHFELSRMALVWPTRLLTWPLGQIAWEHTNYAAFYFALGFAWVLEYLASGGKGRGGWWLAGLLGAAVFLTASRNGWLMLAIALPLVLAGRDIRFAFKSLGLLALAVLLGFACLKTKLALTRPAVATAAVAISSHGSALVKRGSAGRFGIYDLVWKELEGSRLCGRGLAAAGRPVGNLEHEHSAYMATLRGGGLVGLAGHLLVVAAAAGSAVRLMRSGTRWPAVLLATVLGGLMFDRSTVIALSGNPEFIVHWLAVLLPLLLTGLLRQAPECLPPLD